ncbi:poly(ADP-ribose) polymerase pme-5-like [Brachionus plicatilis]|uniref:Poly [ADP-ribose] polymerase n=1 Tax=Brachionus plicatilis TaxID=10195 RepID=A0A3M7PQH6_BRAPC|nr:poly(ADP-ribose) polymerase pme-5-like [Brachionus plicatilis]
MSNFEKVVQNSDLKNPRNNFISYESRFIYENIYKAVLFGHRKLAAYLIENAPPGHGFNSVHIEVLKAENGADLNCQLRSNQCTKKPFANDFITPIHCASINPNVKYLKTLLSITQDFDIQDKKQRRPVHYAAVCQDSTPLEYLITRVSPYQVDVDGNTPLHYACTANRSINCEILLNFAQKKQENDSVQTTEVVIDNKFGLGGVNRPNKRGLLPLHLAIQKGTYECIKVLINYGANLEYALPTSMGKITPLMYAVQLGHNKIAKLLIENNAKIEALDRFKRNAVIHAAMTGSAKILSYLLRAGSSPNVQDSSGNSPLHYACAYGWYFSAKSLVEAGANINLNNDWKLSAFGVAFLKGHIGICDYLLTLGKIDINFRTEEGESLVMLTVSSSINDNNVKQLDYIVNKLGANVKLRDLKGNNAFHYLAANATDTALNLKMADTLVKAGCNANLSNYNLETPLYTSLSNLNVKFGRYLLKDLAVKLDSKSKILFIMAERCMEMDCCHVIFGPDYSDHLIFNKYSSHFEEMAKLKNEHGLTPFQIACSKLNTHLAQIPEYCRKFVLFLYKECKSDPNELVYHRAESVAGDEPDKKAYEPVLFNFVNDKCIDLFMDLIQVNQECINFGLCDSNGFNLLQKAICLGQSELSVRLLDTGGLCSSTDSLKNLLLNKNENILQLCLRYAEYKVFLRVLDLMAGMQQGQADLDNSEAMLKHEDKDGRNVMHYLAELSAKSSLGSFLSSLRAKINLLFGNLAVMNQLCTKVDKHGRQPMHLCLLNSTDSADTLDVQFFLTEFSGFDTADSLNRLPLHYLFLSNKLCEFTEPAAGQSFSQTDPVELLTVLVEKTPKHLLDCQDAFGYTPLHYAALRGATISCSILIANNCSILKENLIGNTPLSSAIYFKRESTILQLLRSDNQGLRELNNYYKFGKIESHDQGMKCSLVEQPEQTQKSIHLFELILSYKWQGINWLILGSLNSYGMTMFDAIETAIIAGDAGLALRLIEKIQRQSCDEYESLLLNKSKNHFNRTLLTIISNTDIESYQNRDALFTIIDKILCSNKMDTYLTEKDDFGSTAIHYACFMLNFHLIDYIFNFLATRPNLPQPFFLLADLPDKHKQSAYSLLFWHIGRIPYTATHLDKIKSYTDKYVSKNRQNICTACYPMDSLMAFRPQEFILGKMVFDYPRTGEPNESKKSALLFAINKQNFTMCKFLLKSLQLDCNTTDSDGVCAMAYAIKVNNFDICQLLLDADYAIDNSCSVPVLKESKTVARTKMLFSLMKNDDEESADESEQETMDDSVSEYNIQPVLKKDKVLVKSAICLDHKDLRSKTLFHHLAEPVPNAAFVNTKVRKLLINAYKSGNYQNIGDFLKRVDSSMKTALDYTIDNSNFELYDELKKLTNSSLVNGKKAFEINDSYFGKLDAKAKPDFKSDSEKFLKNLCLSNPFSHKEDYFKVDALSSMHKIGSLIWDEKHKVPYDVILTKTDISYGVYGLHTFYKMQLISKSLGEKLDEKQSCVLFTRWGRIGDTGNYQRTPFSNFKEARDEFCKIFRQKTGNDFVDTVLEKSKPFETKTRKYNLVKLESRQRPKLNDIKFDLFDTKQFTKESLFDKSVFRDRQEYALFWQDLLNVSYLKSKVHLSNLSTDYLPLTQLSDDCLKKAYQLLDKIRLLIEKRMELEKLSKKDHLVEYMSLIDQVTKLSNQYYELIPQMNFNYEKLTPISNEKDLDAQTSLLNQLTHSQVSCRILMGAKHSMTSSDSPIQNPFDYIYKCLNCKLELMEAQDVHTQFILRYIESTRNANLKVRSVFKFKRLDEKNNLDQYTNRYLLWHGTSTENLVSIMSRGLVISPSDSRLNGNRYGKGIYFSDSFAFSAGFSNGVRCVKETGTYTRCYALLCEVGIGKVKELRTSFETLDSLPKVFDSVKALGQMEPDPSKQVIMANGSVMPLGSMVPVELKPGEYIYSRGSRESQYVVYSEKQCSIRYIVQFDSYC